MDKYTFSYLLFVSSISVTFSYIFGPINQLFMILVGLVAIDYVSGVIAAFIKKSVSSQVGFKGILRKVLIFVIVAVAHMLDLLLETSVVRDMVIIFYIANEILSIVENVSKSGVPIPPIILEKIQLFRKRKK